ncbi:MAG: anion permease [Anaerolineales bacterium]|nr:anion permease [Anaerolineales bacterium]
MTFQMWLALGILALAILLFVTEWIRVDVVALGVVVALMASGLLTTSEALSGFSNPALMTVWALFVVGGGVLQTGLAGVVGRRILAVAGGHPGRLLVVIMLTVAFLSGFMSDTGTVAVLLPAIITLANTVKISPSKLLIPLAFGALLGGMTTLIGTTPNIIASDALREAGFVPFGFFSFMPIGVGLVIAGVLYILLVGRRLLPERQSAKAVTRITTPQELVDLYQLPDNLFRFRIRRQSDVTGKTLQEVGLRHDFGLTAVEIQRVSAPRAVMKVGESALVLQSDKIQHLQPEPELILQGEDVVVVQGAAEDVAHAAAVLNLGVQPISAGAGAGLVSQEVGLAEVLLPPRSNLLGKTIVEMNFGRRFGLTVLGIHGPSAKEMLGVANTRLRFGDILLVQGPWERILALREHRNDFVVMGQPETMVGAPARKRAPIALVILLGMLILMVGEIFPVATVTLLAALLMILTGCLTMDEAYAAIDWKSILLVAGMLPMSIALEKVGLVGMAATQLTAWLGSTGPVAVMAILFLVTTVFTQVLSNTATAVLLVPIALQASLNLGIQPQALVMTVALASSMSFATPVGSPTNILVMGAGNYKFGDYAKVGIPLILVMMVVAMLLLPVLFPF